jgi:hypothetical protein
MPLSDSQVRALQAGERRQSKSAGDSLILVIESVVKGVSKSLEGRMRFPPGRAGKQVPVPIGLHGKGLGKCFLKGAKEERDRTKAVYRNMVWNQVLLTANRSYLSFDLDCYWNFRIFQINP